MKRITAYILIIFTLSWGIVFADSADEFRCVFVEGNVSIGCNGNWSPLEAGAKAASDQSIRISDEGIVTFRAGSNNLTLSSPGTYRIGDIRGEIPQRQKVTVLDTFLTKLKTIMSSGQEVQTQALGVRAAEAEGPGFEWSDVDEDDFELAKEYLEEGAFGDAEFMLEELVMFGNPYQTDEYRFYLAYTHVLQNRTGEALKQLNLIENAGDYDFYEGYLILLGRLYYESMNDLKACETWNRYLEDFPGGNAVEEAGKYLEICN